MEKDDIEQLSKEEQQRRALQAIIRRQRWELRQLNKAIARQAGEHKDRLQSIMQLSASNRRLHDENVQLRKFKEHFANLIKLL